MPKVLAQDFSNKCLLASRILKEDMVNQQDSVQNNLVGKEGHADENGIKLRYG